MSDFSLSEKNVCVILVACIASLFLLVCWTAQSAFHYQTRYYDTRAQLYHLSDLCKQRPDGSAECSSGAFFVSHPDAKVGR